MAAVWLLMGTGIILDAVFIVEFYRKNYLKLLIFKCVSSAFFVMMGILCAISHSDGLGWLIVCGLIFGLIGDFFLDVTPVIQATEKYAFMAGIGSFLIGHLFYITRSLILIGRAHLGIIVLWAVLGCTVGAFLIKLMFKVCSPPKKIMGAGVAYLLVLDFSACLAAGLAASGAGSAAMALGTFLFAVSDHMLVYDFFGNRPIVWFHGVLLILYYLAQCFIALSILG